MCIRDSDEVTVLLKEKEDGRTREGIQRRAKKAQKYAWEQDGFLIRPIATLKELVAEGTKLKHCVAGYASSYAEGRCKLFCIRKKSEPDTPYYTLELGKNDRLVQCRGYRNDIENGYKTVSYTHLVSEPSKSKRKGCSTDRSDQPFRIRELKELVLSHCTPFY